MAFVVEDSTGLSNANAYVTVAFCNDYHSDRGNATWTGTDTVKEQAIVKATDYLDRRYQFTGNKASRQQALEWPRYDVFLNEEYGNRIPYLVLEIPIELQRACAEAALLALSNELIPTPTYDAAGEVTMKREKVGPIETETGYRAAGVAPLKRWPHIDLILKKFLVNSGRSSRG